MRSKRVKPTHDGHPSCPNCGRRDIAGAAFCPDCGQENHPLDLTFGHFFSELLESALHVDSKVFRTLGALLFRPGTLTEEYILGRRRRYVPPVRLYVVVSVLFFFLLTARSGPAQHSPGEKEANTLNLSFHSVPGRELAGLNEAQLDSVLRSNQIELTAANRYVARKLALIELGGQGEFAHLLLKTISCMMFVLMPIFGFFVYLLFRRKAAFYMRRLVFSVHLHSFIFLMLSIFLLAGRVPPVVLRLGMEVALVLVYLGISLFRLFREPLVRTLAKSFALAVLYLAAIFGCLMAVVLTSIVVF